MASENNVSAKFLNQGKRENDTLFSLNSKNGADILIIDDSIEMLSLIKKYISSQSLGKCQVFKNEFHAMNYLSTANVDLLIIDINLTTVDGFKVGEIMRGILKSEVPIIYISGDENYIKKFYQSEQRNSYFMKKPISKKVLKDVIDNMLFQVA
jgi:two-component SAPR family response regulator